MSKEKQQISASKIQLSSSSKTFYVICYVVVGLMALICLLPLLVIIGSSFTSENYIRFHGYTLIPREFNLDAYAMIFKNPLSVLNAYGVSILIMVVGTGCGLFLTVLTAYVLSRKDFKYRNGFSFFFSFNVADKNDSLNL